MNFIINGVNFNLSEGGQNDIESLTPDFSYLNGRRFQLIDSQGAAHLLRFNDLIGAALAKTTTFSSLEDSEKICASLLSLKDKGYPHEGPALMNWVIALKRFFGNFCQKDLLIQFSQTFSAATREDLERRRDLIGHFGTKDHPFLQTLFTGVKHDRDEHRTAIEMLSIFRPDDTEDSEPTNLSAEHINAIESFMALKSNHRLAELLPTQASKNSPIAAQQKFLDAIKVICPTPNSMTFDERTKLIRGIFYSIESNSADDLIKLDSERIKTCLSENEELANNYRKSYSRLIYQYCPSSIARIFQEIFDPRFEAEEREELIVTLMEQSKITDTLTISDTLISSSFYTLTSSSSYLRKNVQFAYKSPIKSLEQLPRGERQELMMLANRWFEEDPEFIEDYKNEKFREYNKGDWNRFNRFYGYRAFLLRELVQIPQADRAGCELQLRRLEKCVYYYSIQNWLPTIAPEKKLVVLEKIGSLLERLDEKSKYKTDVTSIIKACTCLYENQQFWMMDPMLNFLQPSGDASLIFALDRIAEVASRCSVTLEKLETLLAELDATLFSPNSSFRQSRDALSESSPPSASALIDEKSAIVQSLLAAPTHEKWLVKAFNLLLSSKSAHQSSEGVKLVSKFGADVDYANEVSDIIELLYGEDGMKNFGPYALHLKVKFTRVLHSLPGRKREGIVATLRSALAQSETRIDRIWIIQMMLVAAHFVGSTELPCELLAKILLNAIPKCGRHFPWYLPWNVPKIDHSRYFHFA